MEFIQLHLIEKGIPADLTKFNSHFWSKLLFVETKPLIFQSPLKVFFKQGAVFGLMWGILMWLLVWHTTPENWMRYLIASVAFGFVMGGMMFYRITKAQKKLGNVSWEEWLRNNYDSIP